MKFNKQFIWFCSIILSVAGNKYSREANENIGDKISIDQNKPFRMQKLNIIWQTANKKLQADQLYKLLGDLKNQDKDELELKRIKADNQDPDGTKENQIQRQLRMILKKYGLDFETFQPQLESQSTNDNKKQDDIHMFKDKKLDSLWKKIHKLDLSEDQLTILTEELKEFEEKLQNYHKFAEAYDDKQRRTKTSDENHIETNNLESSHNDDEIKDILKVKHLQLKDHYQRINDMIYSQPIKSKDTEFEEEKAARLWQMALKSDFTEEELIELKEKLLHFQNRIKKLTYFTGQLDIHMMKKSISDNELGDGQNQDQAIQKHLETRVKELDSHVKKVHQQLEEKILSRHSEL